MYPEPTLNGQLIWIVDVFCKILGPEACKRRVGLFGIAIWERVKRFERRFCKLHAQWKAGTLPPRSSASSAVKSLERGEAQEDTSPRPTGSILGSSPRTVASLPHSGEGERPAVAAAFDPGAHDAASMDWARMRPASVLPRAFAWLPGMLPLSGGALLGGVSSLLLNFPEMKAFAAECPQVGRLLRPICRMAGMKVPDYLALPKRKRKRGTSSRLSEADEAKLRRITARFPDTPPARAAKRVWRRMFEGKPVDLTKLSAIALGYVLHPPRDGNCPPPEIGYGGRSFPRVPKDYVPPRD